MKKLFFSFALVAAALSASAAESLKPVKGDIGTEVNISLFNNNQNVSVDGITLRYYFLENMVARATLSYSGYSRSENNEIQTSGGGSSKLSQSTSDFGFSLGAEYHFKGNARLAPYVGAEFGFKFVGTNDKLHTKDNAGNLLTPSHEYVGTTINDTHAGVGFGVGVFTGLDFYVYKGLYTGVEFGLYYTSITQGQWNKRDYQANKSWTETKSTDINKNTNIFSSFVLSATPSLKLGWKF